jgi:hypothetical protein
LVRLSKFCEITFVISGAPYDFSGCLGRGVRGLGVGNKQLEENFIPAGNLTSIFLFKNFSEFSFHHELSFNFNYFHLISICKDFNMKQNSCSYFSLILEFQHECAFTANVMRFSQTQFLVFFRFFLSISNAFFFLKKKDDVSSLRYLFFLIT